MNMGEMSTPNNPCRACMVKWASWAKSALRQASPLFCFAPMTDFHLRVQKFLDRFRSSGSVEVSVSQLTLLLQVAYQSDPELLSPIGEAILKQEVQFLATAVNRANLPEEAQQILKEGTRLAQSLDLELRQVFNRAPVKSATISLSRTIVEALARTACQTHPEDVGKLPIEILASLELSAEEFSQLLCQAPTPARRRRLMQAAGTTDELAAPDHEREGY